MANGQCKKRGCTRPVEYDNGHCRDCEEKNLSRAARDHGPKGRESRSRLYGAKEDEHETRHGVDDDVDFYDR
jgi:hypothetical protein